jgi:hypothetical protein
MSNTLTVRRVRVQTIDADGAPEGEATYGVMAADDYAQGYNDTFRTLAELNTAIQEAGCILDLVDDSGDLFVGIDRDQIGTDNFFGKFAAAET